MANCVSAAKTSVNAIMLNHSTDGMSCEVQSNLEQQCDYLKWKSDQLSFPDTNHNVKNVWYQLVGGSGDDPAVLGNYIFDTALLKMAGVAKEHVRIDDYASDALVL